MVWIPSFQIKKYTVKDHKIINSGYGSMIEFCPILTINVLINLLSL